MKPSYILTGIGWAVIGFALWTYRNHLASLLSRDVKAYDPVAVRTDWLTRPWTKTFAAFKKNVRIAYTWEGVLFVPGRDSSKDGAPVGRDHLSAPITMRKGFTGAKPRVFCDWVLDLLGWIPGDELYDLYPGTGVMGSVIKARLWELEEINGQSPLDFGSAP
jgi:hypothetical protein